jgi:hypothetical protein
MARHGHDDDTLDGSCRQPLFFVVFKGRRGVIGRKLWVLGGLEQSSHSPSEFENLENGNNKHTLLAFLLKKLVFRPQLFFLSIQPIKELLPCSSMSAF